MSQWVNHEGEFESSELKTESWTFSCNSSNGERRGGEREIPGTSWPTSLAYSPSCNLMRGPCLNLKQREEGAWGATLEVDLWPPLAHICLHDAVVYTWRPEDNIWYTHHPLIKTKLNILQIPQLSIIRLGWLKLLPFTYSFDFISSGKNFNMSVSE